MEYFAGLFIILSIILFDRYRTLKISSDEKIKFLETKCHELQNALAEKEQIYNSYDEKSENVNPLQSENNNLRNAINFWEDRCKYYEQINRDLLSENNIYYEYFEKHKDDYLNTEEFAFRNRFYSNPADYYFLKASCLTRNESLMYYYIKEAVDDFFPFKNSKKKTYAVFSQVALYSLFDKKESSVLYEDKIISYAYMAKSIDYVVCRCKYNKERQYFEYEPCLLIELDGDSHSSSDFAGYASLRHQQDCDKFKDDLLGNLKIPFIRYDHRGKNIGPDDGLKIKKLIHENLDPKIFS